MCLVFLLKLHYYCIFLKFLFSSGYNTTFSFYSIINNGSALINMSHENILSLFKQFNFVTIILGNELFINISVMFFCTGVTEPNYFVIYYKILRCNIYYKTIKLRWLTTHKFVTLFHNCVYLPITKHTNCVCFAFILIVCVCFGIVVVKVGLYHLMARVAQIKMNV